MKHGNWVWFPVEGRAAKTQTPQRGQAELPSFSVYTCSVFLFAIWWRGGLETGLNWLKLVQINSAE